MGVHYSGQSQISIGARFAYEAARLAGKDTGSVRSGRYDLPLGSPDAWMNRKMPGKNVCVWNVASSVKPSLVSGVVKLFGIRVEDRSGRQDCYRPEQGKFRRPFGNRAGRYSPGGGEKFAVEDECTAGGPAVLEYSGWFCRGD